MKLPRWKLIAVGLDNYEIVEYNQNTFASHDNAESGLVLVSTGVQKFGKPSAGRDRITIRTLKLNADENLAYAA